MFTRLPFDWRTPLGYLIAFFFIYASAIVGFMCIIPTICLAISSCWLACSFIDDIATDLKEMNALMKQSSSPSSSASNQMEINQLLRSAMFDVSSIKELSEIFSYTYKSLNRLPFISNNLIHSGWFAYSMMLLNSVLRLFSCIACLGFLVPY